MVASIDDIWQWLEQVPDPEIPVISVVDLGIVRHVAWDDGTLVVTVTPTYSGCPATRVINEDIQACLDKKGIQNSRIEFQLSPAWTTDWLSASARKRLQDYGIATPTCAGSADETRVLHAKVLCPRCRSVNTALMSQFGSTPCKAAYRCNECLEAFDYFKPI